jgi:hypothetical protein
VKKETSDSRAGNPDSFVASTLFACTAICLALQAWLATVLEINWDEFYYLSQIYDWRRGELTTALQTFHVHLFGWLTLLGGDEIHQIVIGRFAMLACELVTCALVYLLARAFFSRRAALLAVLTYVSSGYTMLYGASFRTDPLAAMLVMAALVVVARAPTTTLSAVAAGFCAALSALVTVKVVFFAPAFLALGAWRWRTSPGSKQALFWLTQGGAATLVLFGVLYSFHLHSLPEAGIAASGAMMKRAGSTTILDAGFLPRGDAIAHASLLSPVQTVLIVIAIGGIAFAIGRSPGERFRLLVVLGCAASLLSLLFYRNAFPYFFPFIFPSAMVLVAWVVDVVALSDLFLVVLAMLMTGWAAMVAMLWSSHDQATERQLVSAVHRMFPRPVAYIDRNSMIASFPKRGFFMSTWGLLNYHQGPPLFADIVAHETVPLLIVNGPALEQAVGLNSDVSPEFQLYTEDAQVLRNNYVPQWGRIWVAGKRVEATPAGRGIPIAIPGTYTVEDGPVTIDGVAENSGATIALSRGTHVIEAATPHLVTLRWGDHLYKPPEAPRDQPIYRGF